MTRLLGLLTSLLLTVTLVACGDESSGGSSGEDPSVSSSGSTPADPDDDAAPPTDVEIVSQTNAGGEVDQSAVRLDSQADVDEFLTDFSEGELTEGVQKVFDARDDGDGTILLAAVVAVGCDVPKDVNLATDSGDPVLTPVKVKETTNQCLAAVTSVALMTVAESSLD